MNRRIGIFAGSFDPVHKGHVAFALEAIKQAKLDEVYFLPEIQPRKKPGISHVGHRVAMLNLALRSHAHLHVLELPDKQFTPTKTLPRLQQKFAGDKLFLLMGTDVLARLSTWPNFKSLLNQTGLVVAKKKGELEQTSSMKPGVYYFITTPEPSFSSSSIRKAVQNNVQPKGLLASVRDYINKNWLYRSIR